MNTREARREREGEDGNSSHASADKDLSLPLGIPGRRRPRFDGLAWHVVGSGGGEGGRFSFSFMGKVVNGLVVVPVDIDILLIDGYSEKCSFFSLCHIYSAMTLVTVTQ